MPWQCEPRRAPSYPPSWRAECSRQAAPFRPWRPCCAFGLHSWPAQVATAAAEPARREMTGPCGYRVATRDPPPAIQAAPSAPAQTSGQEHAHARPADRQTSNLAAAGLAAAARQRAVGAENLRGTGAGWEPPSPRQEGRQAPLAVEAR